MTAAFNLDGSTCVVSTRANPGLIDNTKTGATNLGSNAVGTGVGATKDYSTVLGGDGCDATGDYATATGYQSKASGAASTCFGTDCQASGANSFASGSSTVASGQESVAIGGSSSAKGDRSFAAGSSNIAWQAGCAVLGTANISGKETPDGDGDGSNSLCAGFNNQATGLISTAIGQSNFARGRLSFTQGEDVETLAGAAGESCVAMNHFNTAGARASTVMGCNNWSTGDGSRSFVHGFSAKATRESQHAHAAGGFSDDSNSEDMLHTYAAGDAQTSRTVFRGGTAGSAAGEFVSKEGTLGQELISGPAAEGFLALEDGKAYAMKATLIAVGNIIEGETVTPVTRKLTRDAVYRCDGGVAALIAEGEPEAPRGTATITDSWTLHFSVNNASGATLRMTTGDTIARIRVACLLEFTEVVYPT